MYVIPCNLNNPAYMYFPSCSKLSFEKSYATFLFGLLLQIVMPLLMAMIALHKFGQCAMEYFLFSVIHCYCLINYIDWFYKHFRKTCQDEFSKYNQIYREIQLLMDKYNSVHQGPLTLTTIGLCAYVFIISFYAMTGFLDQLIVLQILFFSVLAFDTFTIVAMVDGTFKAGVLKASKQMLCGVQEKMAGLMITKRPKMLYKRQVRSWPLFKVYTGSVNYYEEETTLVFLDFNINQVVNLLMI